jgi:hypothetical protein
MPLIYLSVSALALYGLLQLPTWLREFTLVFVACLFAIATMGFFYGLVVKSLPAIFKTENEEPTKPSNDSGGKVTAPTRETSKSTVVELMRQADEEATLQEDDFLH